MTLRYELTKKYLKQEEIEIFFNSYRDFRLGKRDTLDYLIEGQIITRKPLIKDYRNYTIIYPFSQVPDGTNSSPPPSHQAILRLRLY